MRFSPSISQTAADFINNASLTDMLKVFREYGEERNSLRIARRIIDERAKQEFRTTGQLADVIKHLVPGEFQVKTLSRIFQAIRMHINSEVAVLQQALADAVSLLAADGRIVVISYHSIEDRIVNQHFKIESKDCICPPEFPVCQCHHKAR
jgi:16S rRNA (cytosine1402-N4)-methyltransferase